MNECDLGEEVLLRKRERRWWVFIGFKLGKVKHGKMCHHLLTNDFSNYYWMGWDSTKST